MEKGEATHLFAVDPRKIKSGEVPIEEVPYMQRAGGAWDGSDLKGAALRRAKKKQSQGMYTAISGSTRTANTRRMDRA